MSPSTTTVTKNSSLLLQRLRFLKTLITTPNNWVVQLFRNVLGKLLENQHVAELLRFIFLGTVVETTRLAGQKAVDFAKHFFVVKATFVRGDFAFDWVKRYLEDKKVWDHSRIFQVSACHPARRIGHAGVAEKEEELGDGRPHPVYQPAPLEPELFRWRNYWISVNMVMGSGTANSDGVSCLTLSVWSRNRKILDEFVQEARTHYFESPLPPRELFILPDDSGSLLTARFGQGDSSYDWMVAFIRAQEGYEDITDLQVTTKQADLPFASGDEERPIAAFKPAPRVKQRLRWRDHWLQFDVEPTNPSYDGRNYGGSVTVTLHNSKRSILHDLVMAAREEYLKSTTSKVTVHIADRYGSWVKAVTKNRRALNTLILPDGIKEKLIADAREFLASEEWYTWAGVPHRRGYLLYGEPGTGKSSTIHALASELGLEIYYVQLSSQGMDDHSLGRLIADTPSRCILLLEDIDCAFSTREDDDEEEQEYDMFGNPVPNPYVPVRTEVTLSGLLNVLDSVTSEEGRITFATTNHLERLDPALIRAGRMDVKIEYKLATRSQISKTFLRFFEHRFVPVNGVNRPSILAIKDEGSSSSSEEEELPPPTDEEIQTLAESFGDRVPEGTFALAAVQGYLLTKKMDARKAVADVEGWVTEQLEEKKRLQDLKDKKKQKKKERMERAKEMRLAMEKEAKEKEAKDNEAMPKGKGDEVDGEDDTINVNPAPEAGEESAKVTEHEERPPSPIMISPPESA